MFCAGDLQGGGPDACQGDSGGPAVAIVHGKATLIGKTLFFHVLLIHIISSVFLFYVSLIYIHSLVKVYFYIWLDPVMNESFELLFVTATLTENIFLNYFIILQNFPPI